MSEINTWPGWNCIGTIGAGSFGRVYKIERERQDLAALKVISVPGSPEDVQEIMESGLASTEEEVSTFINSQIESFTNEVQLMAALRGNPNIVELEDYMILPHEGWLGADILIRMELLTPLSNYMKRNPMEERDILRLGMEMCQALMICHTMRPQILHRDIKAANIMVSEEGVFKLGDFGVARVMEGTKSAHTKAGTEDYMAPEVMQSKGYFATADIYSLGILLYKLLNNGRGPFLPPEGGITESIRMEAMQKRLDGEKIPPPLHGGSSLQKAILRVLEYNPKKRHQTAAEFYSALSRIDDGTYLDPTHQKPVWRQKKKIYWIAVTGVILGCVFIAVMLLLKDRNQIPIKPQRKTQEESETEEKNQAEELKKGEITADSSKVYVGETLEVSFVTGEYIFRSDDDLVWESSDDAVAQVDQKGIVTGVSPGTVTITGTYRGDAGSMVIRVMETPETTPPTSQPEQDTTQGLGIDSAVIESISIITRTDALLVGDSADVRLKAGGWGLESNSEGIEWSVDDSSIASYEDGAVRAKSPGTFRLTAKYRGCTDSKEMRVVELDADSDARIEVDYDSLSLAYGREETITMKFLGGLPGSYGVMAYYSAGVSMTLDLLQQENNSAQLKIHPLTGELSEGYITILCYDSNQKEHVVAVKKIRVKVD